ncbi:hypothetical protein EV426DRAFT_639370 [Tirmania nivea]|nr:hypothetical protein EV426DRAFT_639370 [Tirmania nivea]
MKSTLFVSAFFAAALLVCAAPASTSVEARSQQPQVFLPDIMIQIKEAWPDHAYGDTEWGLVSRRNGKENVQTLMSIHIPSHVSGKKCRYIFTEPHDLGGSMSAQLFTVIGKIPHDATFNKRPSRDRHIATLKIDWETAMAGENAQFTYFGGDSFDCPGGKSLHLELVPVNDDDYIEWYEPYGFAVVADGW